MDFVFGWACVDYFVHSFSYPLLDTISIYLLNLWKCLVSSYTSNIIAFPHDSRSICVMPLASLVCLSASTLSKMVDG